MPARPINRASTAASCHGAAPQAEMPPVNAFVCTVEIPSLHTALSQSLALGDMVALLKLPSPGVGWLAYGKDPDGHILGLLQPDQQAAYANHRRHGTAPCVAQEPLTRLGLRSQDPGFYP